MTYIPDYPFFEATAPEYAFGAMDERYLQITKTEANEICAALPEETKMADMLFALGHLGEDAFGMGGRECAVEATAEQIRSTTGALLRSFGPPHQVKIATVAVALHRWFPKQGASDVDVLG